MGYTTHQPQPAGVPGGSLHKISWETSESPSSAEWRTVANLTGPGFLHRVQVGESDSTASLRFTVDGGTAHADSNFANALMLQQLDRRVNRTWLRFDESLKIESLINTGVGRIMEIFYTLDNVEL